MPDPFPWPASRAVVRVVVDTAMGNSTLRNEIIPPSVIPFERWKDEKLIAAKLREVADQIESGCMFQTHILTGNELAISHDSMLVSPIQNISGTE